MKDNLAAGITHTHTFRVPLEKTVPRLYPESALFREMPEVFATGYLVGFIEWACMEALQPFLDEGERSVGTMINVSHSAATPPGMEVTAQVRLVEVNGKRTLWEVEVHDEKDLISKGSHERFTINLEQFKERLKKKEQG
ncbi:thioesterase [Geomonas silvestris]|uniref:Thioesterase n=1 Tax=Geomonas silvestris TaxID=2740184 RepID=A0A6V8MKF5_9BACT|nr:thioesterase family protein [Geomonas silvestris]GFO60407.1 thioesterase [Geomonas silvestris]